MAPQYCHACLTGRSERVVRDLCALVRVMGGTRASGADLGLSRPRAGT